MTERELLHFLFDFQHAACECSGGGFCGLQRRLAPFLFSPLLCRCVWASNFANKLFFHLISNWKNYGTPTDTSNSVNGLSLFSVCPLNLLNSISERSLNYCAETVHGLNRVSSNCELSQKINDWQTTSSATLTELLVGRRAIVSLIEYHL